MDLELIEKLDELINIFDTSKEIDKIKNLKEKIYSNDELKEKINRFKSEFNKIDSYSGHDFFKWHHILTGSCLMGRNEFVEDNKIDLDNIQDKNKQDYNY